MKKCALVGYDFKMCLEIINTSYKSGVHIDDILDIMTRGGKKPQDKSKAEYVTAEEVLKDIAKHFYDGSDGIEWCWQEGTSLESRGDDKLAKALRPYLEDK